VDQVSQGYPVKSLPNIDNPPTIFNHQPTIQSLGQVDEVSQALLDLELPHEKYLLLGDHDVDIRYLT